MSQNDSHPEKIRRPSVDVKHFQSNGRRGAQQPNRKQWNYVVAGLHGEIFRQGEQGLQLLHLCATLHFICSSCHYCLHANWAVPKVAGQTAANATCQNALQPQLQPPRLVIWTSYHLQTAREENTSIWFLVLNLTKPLEYEWAQVTSTSSIFWPKLDKTQATHAEHLCRKLRRKMIQEYQRTISCKNI